MRVTNTMTNVHDPLQQIFGHRVDLPLSQYTESYDFDIAESTQSYDAKQRFIINRDLYAIYDGSIECTDHDSFDPSELKITLYVGGMLIRTIDIVVLKINCLKINHSPFSIPLLPFFTEDGRPVPLLIGALTYHEAWIEIRGLVGRNVSINFKGTVPRRVATVSSPTVADHHRALLLKYSSPDDSVDAEWNESVNATDRVIESINRSHRVLSSDRLWRCVTAYLVDRFTTVTIPYYLPAERGTIYAIAGDPSPASAIRCMAIAENDSQQLPEITTRFVAGPVPRLDVVGTTYRSRTVNIVVTIDRCMARNGRFMLHCYNTTILQYMGGMAGIVRYRTYVRDMGSHIRWLTVPRSLSPDQTYTIFKSITDDV